MKIKKEKKNKTKIFKYIIYFLIGICLSYNIIFSLNTTITKKDYMTVLGITFFNMENDLMKDDISQNDLVIVKKVKEKKIQEGDIIAYTVNGQTRINKIINTKNGYTTKSNKSYYPNIEKISYEDVIGKKIAVISTAGNLLNVMQSKTTSLVLFLFFILSFLYNIYIHNKKIERARKKQNAGGRNG